MPQRSVKFVILKMRYIYLIMLSFMLFFGRVDAIYGQSAKPFPQHTRYFIGTIKPNHISQVKLDNVVINFYKQWKTRFVKNVPGKPQSYIWFENKGGKQCVSEGQGYGMIIVALMGGNDASAKATYDNLFNYFHSHPTGRNRYLMAWAQNTKGKDLDNTSATDGDMDIAYSLLLASKQWGNTGAINYLQQAKLMINAIMLDEINHKTWSVLLSDGVEAESKDYFATRSSDFMPAHFKAFQQATNDTRWGKVVDAGYRLFGHMQTEYSPDAGLLADFIININKTPKPAGAHFLEDKYDGQYNYNACRVPWRIATDYLITGDRRSKNMVSKINRWVRETTNNNTYNLSAGYTLAGNDIKGRYFEALSFVAPFGVSAMVDGKNQRWLNHVWDYLVAFKLKDYDYYDNSIKLLNMLIMSGNYWR
jgi:endo-1,4-beta-D-glucanase Y